MCRVGTYDTFLLSWENIESSFTSFSFFFLNWFLQITQKCEIIFSQYNNSTIDPNLEFDFTDINGFSWGPWSSWSPCSIECKPGESQGRSRLCLKKSQIKSFDLKPCLTQVCIAVFYQIYSPQITTESFQNVPLGRFFTRWLKKIWPYRPSRVKCIFWR